MNRPQQLLSREERLPLRRNSSQIRPTILVGVAGGSASGKTTICSTLAELIAFEQGLRTTTVPLDCFYKPLAEGAVASEINFDHPDALDMDLAQQVL
jgi:uridine kinase